MTKKTDIDVVRNAGKRMQTPHLDVRTHDSRAPQPRIGLIVPKYKHQAADRNRLRRRLRELIRLELLPHLLEGDTLIRAKSDAYDASYSTLRVEIGSVKTWMASPRLQ